MIRYDPTLVDLTSNFFVQCTNVKVYAIIQWVELSMNIHEGKGQLSRLSKNKPELIIIYLIQFFFEDDFRIL